MLNREKLPYLLAALLGFVTWTLTRAVDRIVEAPLLKYIVSDRQTSAGRVATYEVENISTQLFKSIQVVVFLENSVGAFAGLPALVPELPMMVDRDTPPTLAPDSATFVLPELHPGWRFQIRAGLSADAAPGLGVRSPNAAIRLVQGSFRTWLVENELWILLALSVAGIILVIGYLLAIDEQDARNAEITAGGEV
jgi:hypothetical protein